MTRCVKMNNCLMRSDSERNRMNGMNCLALNRMDDYRTNCSVWNMMSVKNYLVLNRRNEMKNCLALSRMNENC